MAKFFVGQKVRVISAVISKGLIGKEARVLEVDAIAKGLGKTKYRGFRLDLINYCGLPFIAESHEIEPILPEGAQPSEFSFTELMDNLGVVVA